MTGDPSREPTRVFISYTHDSDKHRWRALRLTDWLRSVEIDAWIDQYQEDNPPHSWPMWMHQEVTKADFVLMICTETYQRRVQGEEEPGKGRGALWEGALITHSIYHSQKFAEPSPYIPVVFDRDDLQYLPYFVSGASHYVVDINTDQGIDPIVRRILHQPKIVPHPLGQPLTDRPSAPSTASRRRGARPRAVGSAASKGMVPAPAALEDATFQALSRVAGASSNPSFDVILMYLRQIAARFSEALPAATYGPANVSLWQIFASTDDLVVQPLLSTSPDGLLPEWPPAVRLSSIDLFQRLLLLNPEVEGRPRGIVSRKEDGTARAAWLIAARGHHEQEQTYFEREWTAFGFLTAKTSDPLSRHFRLMGQRVADRLAAILSAHQRRQYESGDFMTTRRAPS